MTDRSLPSDIAELVLNIFRLQSKDKHVLSDPPTPRYNPTTLLSISISSFALELLPLPRLTAVSSPAFFFLVSAHACSQGNVNAWRGGKTETLCHLDQVELVDVKDRSQTMRGVCL